MKAVFLDGHSLDQGDLDFSDIKRQVDTLDIHPSTSDDNIASRIAGYDIALTNKIPLGREHLKGSGLKLICVAATGTNNIDLRAARDLGLVVTNCQGYGTDSVAQHALGLMLNLSNSMLRYVQAVSTGDWHKSRQFCLLDYPIQELAGKNLGIVGYGTLGKRVAELGQAFGMNVLVSARPGSSCIGNGRMSFGEILTKADYLSLHCPLTNATRGLIGASELAQMKPSAYLVNTARGALVDERALIDALDRGQIAGAGLDVVDGEPPTSNNPLFDKIRPNLLITPHSSWGAKEARQRVVTQIAENIAAWRGQRPLRVVQQG